MPGTYDDIPIAPDPVLSQVKQRESGGRNLPPTANYDYPRSHASGLYQIQPGTWKDWTSKTGIGKGAAEAYQATPDEQTANAKFAEKTYGPNTSYTWAASAPKGGYRAPKGAYDDIPMEKTKGKSAYDDIPMEKAWRVSPTQEGPRANIRGVPQGMPAPPNLPPQMGPMQRPPGPMDPSIQARQNAAPQQLTGVGAAGGAEALGMQNAAGAKVAQWLGMKAAHGYDWASKLSPDLISNAIGAGQDWTANKLQDVAEGIFRKLGADNPETQAHNLTSFVLYDLPMYRAGQMGEAAGRIGEMIKSPAMLTKEGHIAEGVNHPAIRAAGADGEPGFTTTGPIRTIEQTPEEIQAERTRQHKELIDRLVKETATKPLDLRPSDNFVDREQGAQIAEQAGQTGPLQGSIRLYRGEGNNIAGTDSGMAGGWFTTNPEKAARFGDVSYVDVPHSELNKFVQGHGGPDEFLTDNPKFRQQMKPLSELHSEDLKPGTSQARPNFSPVGAAATPTHEILAQNIRSREVTLAATDPTFKQNMRRAGNALKSITAPETMREVDTGEQLGKEAAANIREKIGMNEREKQISAQALNQYYKMFNGVTPEEGLTVIDWLQSKPGTLSEGGYLPTPETESFMNAFRKEMQGLQGVLETLPKTENMNFKQNFVSQMWENPKQTLDRIIGGKGASNYFTKKSVWASYKDGIRQGGVPISTNPLELGVRYIDNARNLITQYQIIDTAADTNRMVWRTPGEGPPGWVEVGGRARNYKGIGQIAYAPPGYAAVYNNYVSTLPQGAMGDLLTSIQRTANAATMVNLGLSGFHASLMMQESMASGIANAIDNITHGKMLYGAAKLAESLPPGLYAATSIWRAREGINEYLNKGSGNLRTQKAVRALSAANFRMRGRGSITDEYRASFLPDLVTSFRKGRMKMEAAQATADIMKHPVAGTGRQVASLVLRTLDTISAPVFQYAVPRLKTGAALDMMYTYMRRKPNASDMELAAYARQVSNIIDDRFGEMNHDNIFFHKLQKTVMQSMVVSYSYEYGSARAAAGAIGDTANFLKGGWTPQMSYPIALFASMAIHSAMYQYLMTGKAIGSMQDVHAPQTGGTDPRSGKPGRAVLPQQLNQAFGFWNDPRQETTNKLNVLWKTVWDLWGAMGPTGGYDWKNDPIVDKNAPGIEQLAQAGYFAMSSFAPISLSQQAQPGSAIPGWQRGMGIRDAAHRFVDPQGSAEGLRWVNAEKWVKQQQNEGKYPRYIPHKQFNILVRQHMNQYRGIQ